MTKQNKQYESKLAELSAQLEKQSADFERERAEFETDKSELEALQNAATETKELLKSISDVALQIVNDNARISTCVSAISEEKASDRAKLAEMASRVAEAEKLREKAEKFDQLSGVLSSIFNQTEITSEVKEVSDESAFVEESADSKSVAELSDLIAVFSAHCDKLQSILSNVDEKA